MKTVFNIYFIKLMNCCAHLKTYYSVMTELFGYYIETKRYHPYGYDKEVILLIELLYSWLY